MTAEKLGQAIREVIADSEMHQRAEALGEKIKDENGVTQVVEFIKKRLSQSGNFS